MEEEAERLKRMVAELLEFARPMVLRVSDGPLGPIVAGAVEAACAGASEPASVEVEIAADLPAVRCDPQLLRQAVINLVTNALQAPNRRGQVRVRATAHGHPHRACVKVLDDGGDP